MERSVKSLSRLHFFRGDQSGPSPPQAAPCEAMLSVLSGKLQILIDHVSRLEDRIHYMESSSRQDDTDQADDIINAGAVRIDHAARQVFVGGAEVPLSPTEYRLIYQLAMNSGKVVLHSDLLRRASVHGEVNPGNLKVYIGRLRAKLNSGHEAKCDLKAVRGVGYRLSA